MPSDGTQVVQRKSATSKANGFYETHFPNNTATIYIIFTSLLLDLLAFTMILPLLPSLLDYYRVNDHPHGIYSILLSKIQIFQRILGTPDRFSSVLFGGFLGSLFSFLQFIASPLVGGLSDVYGRKPILLLCLLGISFSYIIWAVSYNFGIFVIARIIGGISKGNISLSTAIIADVSSSSNRGKGMALVGIAFSVGFIVGPVIGALFARWSHGQMGNWYTTPALFAFTLSFTNILFISIYFKETLPKNKRAGSIANSIRHAFSYINLIDLFDFKAVKNLSHSDKLKLRQLGFVYFVYLFLYSGLEFTLTFLTHHKFNYSSMQQGLMFFAIGFIMAMLQGTYVRRLPKHHVKPTAILGLLLIVPSFICVGLAESPGLLYVGLFLFAISTAMVVTCMMTMVSHYGSHDQKGTVLGIFRSLGALARALGPIFASICYWSIGPFPTYCFGGICLLWPWYSLKSSI